MDRWTKRKSRRWLVQRRLWWERGFGKGIKGEVRQQGKEWIARIILDGAPVTLDAYPTCRGAKRAVTQEAKRQMASIYLPGPPASNVSEKEKDAAAKGLVEHLKKEEE